MAPSMTGRAVWAEDMVERMVEQARGGQFEEWEDAYQPYETRAVLRGLRAAQVGGKRVLVVGPCKPAGTVFGARTCET